MSKIVYTHTDEAPLLATYSFLPIIQAYAGVCGVEVETRDISLAGRILAQFPDHLTDSQRVPDSLAELGQLALQPSANIIKLPNISASMPQLKAAIKELQGKGYALPDYPDEPATDAERDIKVRYDKVKGSAVNPVLREGNSDRRAPLSVKDYARKHPHSMGKWSADSTTHVSAMSGGDFFGNEKSVTVPTATDVRIEHVAADGKVTVLKASTKLKDGEIIDGTFMSKKALVKFYEEQVADARAKGVLFSLHLKATMMKVSDPIMFGHAVKAYFADVFAEHGAALDEAGANPNNGLGNVLAAVATLPDDQRTAIEAGIAAAYERGPALAMVDSDRGITNLHVPSDVIVDASMPAMIRTSGQMWNAAGEQQDTLAVLPDSSYAGVYAATIAFCKEHGADAGINYTKEDLKARAKELTNGNGADVVYDPVGGAFSEAALRSIAWEGRFLVVGFAAGEIPKIPLNLALLKGCQICGIFWGSFAMRDPARNRANGARIFEWIEQGKLSPHVDGVFPFADAKSALERMERREVKGKLVLVP